jgi:membrane peptidoglycan carboxypeptidase
MNSEFSYIAYENDKPFRTFMVGLSNPDYTPLEQVSPYLRNAILTSEDGSFFFHNGFNGEAFRKSIATNYEAGKFLRGGSTISMQLIKNVYLSRHKTIARKAEEALLVWLIEGNRLCSKERMFEVYLNIIELGPDVYGVGEASRFYFNKKPSQLTLPESIFLASLLPHPKWFKYSFDENGNLKSYLADYYRVVSNFLLKKNLITKDEYDAIQPNVRLTGLARELVRPSDTIPQEEMQKDK